MFFEGRQETFEDAAQEASGISNNFEQISNFSTNLKSYFHSGTSIPISFTSKYLHPLLTRSTDTKNSVDQVGPGYHSFGLVDRPNLPERELFEERDRVLKFLLRVHLDREGVFRRTEHQSGAELMDIRAHTISSDKVGFICKFVNGTKEQRVKSWPGKVTKIIYETGIRYTQRSLVEEAATEQGRQWLEEHLQANIPRCGLIVHEQLPFLVGQPVGLLNDDKTVEVVVLFDEREFSVEEAIRKTSWLSQEEERIEVQVNSDLYAKIQTDLAVSGRGACIVVITTSKGPPTSFQVEFDNEYWIQRQRILIEFFYYGLVEQADSMRSRSLPPRPYADVEQRCESTEWRTWPTL